TSLVLCLELYGDPQRLWIPRHLEEVFDHRILFTYDGSRGLRIPRQFLLLLCINVGAGLHDKIRRQGNQWQGWIGRRTWGQQDARDLSGVVGNEHFKLLWIVRPDPVTVNGHGILRVGSEIVCQLDGFDQALTHNRFDWVALPELLPGVADV